MDITNLDRAVELKTKLELIAHKQHIINNATIIKVIAPGNNVLELSIANIKDTEEIQKFINTVRSIYMAESLDVMNEIAKL